MKKLFVFALFALFAVYGICQTYTPDGRNINYTGYIKLPGTKTKIGGVSLSGTDVTNMKNAATKVSESVPASNTLILKSDSVYQNPGSYTPRYAFYNEPVVFDSYKVYKKLGTSIKPIFTLTPQISNTTVTPVDNRVCLTLMYCYETTTATGVKFSMNAAGAYTADQTNGFAFFRISQDTAYKIAETANTGTIWTTTANTPTNIAFSAPVTIGPGLYAIGFLYNNSAQTTQPTFTGCQNPILSMGQGLSNGWYLSMNFNTQNSFASFYKSSTYYSNNAVVPIFYIY